jgi:hypothetical protein
MELISAPKSQWDVTNTYYLGKKDAAQMAFLRRLKPTLSAAALEKMPATKTVVVVEGVVSEQKNFALTKDGDYKNGKETILQYLEGLKKRHDLSPSKDKLIVKIV